MRRLISSGVQILPPPASGLRQQDTLNKLRQHRGAVAHHLVHAPDQGEALQTLIGSSWQRRLKEIATVLPSAAHGEMY